MAKGVRKEGSKRKRRADEMAMIRISSSFNNTIITATDMQGNTLCWSSPGKAGFHGTRKSTAYAAQLAAKEVAQAAYDMGVRRVEVWFRGSGPGREAAIRAFYNLDIDVLRIKDITPIKHGGCRPKKRRRV